MPEKEANRRMEFKVAELDEKLAYLAFGYSKSVNQLAYADCVMFENGRAYTFSGGTLASVALDFGFEGVVNYADFAQHIRTLTYDDPDTLIEIYAEEHAFVIKRGRSLTRFPFAPIVPVSLETLGLPDPASWHSVPDGFKQAIKKCEAIFTRQVTSDSILSCLHVTGTCVEAATPEQVIRVKCDMEVPFPFLVKFGRLGKLFGAKFPDPVDYQVTDKWLFFRNFDVVFGIPHSRDSFVSIDRFFVVEGDEVCFPDATSMDLHLFQSFYTQGSGSGVRLAFGGDTCSLSIKTKRGQHSVSFPLKCPENDVYIVTPALLRILAHYGKCTFNGNCVHVKTNTVDYTASVTREGEYAL